MNKKSYEKLKPLIRDYVKDKLNEPEVASLFQKLLDTELIWGFPVTYEKKLYELVDKGLVKVTAATKGEFEYQRESGKRFDDSLTEEERKEMQFENTTLLKSFKKFVKMSLETCFGFQQPVKMILIIDDNDKEHILDTLVLLPHEVVTTPEFQKIAEPAEEQNMETIIKEHGVKAILTSGTFTFPGFQGKRGMLVVTLEAKTPVKSDNLAKYRSWLYEFKGGRRMMFPYPYKPPFGEDDGGSPFMPSDDANAPKWIKLYFKKRDC
jgi:hypothetical protein